MSEQPAPSPDAGQSTPAERDGESDRTANGGDFDSLAAQVTERVWKLWREDLRRSGERRGDLAARP
jgi:hypothetical protein